MLKMWQHLDVQIQVSYIDKTRYMINLEGEDHILLKHHRMKSTSYLKIMVQTVKGSRVKMGGLRMQ